MSDSSTRIEAEVLRQGYQRILSAASKFHPKLRDLLARIAKETGQAVRLEAQLHFSHQISAKIPAHQAEFVAFGKELHSVVLEVCPTQYEFPYWSQDYIEFQGKHGDFSVYHIMVADEEPQAATVVASTATQNRKYELTAEDRRFLKAMRVSWPEE